MKVYLLMEYGGIDATNIVRGVFARREDAEATMAAVEALPWKRKEFMANTHLDRDGYIGPGPWSDFHQSEIIWKGEPVPCPLPPAPFAVEEVEVLEAALPVYGAVLTTKGWRQKR